MSDPATQLASASPNFAFLTQLALPLAVDGAQAELYVYPDPDGAVVKMRRFTESLAKLLMRRAGIGPDPKVQAKRIDALAKQGAIPGHIVTLFTAVRHLGNAGAHEPTNDRAGALTALQHCFELATWWYQTETGASPPVAFTQPVPEDPRPLRKLLEDVETHMAGLHAALDASLARPEPSITIGRAGSPASGWHGGTEVECGSRRYLLHDPIEHIQAGDGSWRLMTADARRLDAKEAVRLTGLFLADSGPNADRMARALRDQAALASGQALPRLVSHHDTSDPRILVTTRPAIASTWREMFGEGRHPLDPLIVPVALGVLADVAEALAVLHRTGHAHRAVSAESVLAAGSGRRGVLRDLGLAGFPRLAGEGGQYPAPEQLSMARGRPGPATDVYQLAALLHHTCAGFAPSAGLAAPLGSILPGFPEPLDRRLRDALSPDPASRPAMTRLADTIKQARRQLFTETIV